MRFGKNLQKSRYEPWKDHYIDYNRLKSILREDDAQDNEDSKPWTADDEQHFSDELFNVQLNKVKNFHDQKHNELKERTNKCNERLEELLASKKDGEEEDGGEGDKKKREDLLDEVSEELDGINKEIIELEKFSRLNFTGALKAVKKHDRRRGTNYKLKPMLQVRLSALQFNSEDYSPLLYRLSTMYDFVRKNLDSSSARKASMVEPRGGGGQYTSHKFFVHQDNLLEVKTFVLRHLPVLVYTPNSLKVADGRQGDPTITALYFDNPQFSLYNGKVEKGSGASSLRVRWFGQLDDKPELLMEKKTLCEGDDSDEVRFNIKEKYVMPFVEGEYKMEKGIQKLRGREGEESQKAANLENNASDIQKFILENDLQPVVRASYTRMAFQIPGDDLVRVSIDTNLAFIREDALDSERPCRDPHEWHRMDIDGPRLEFPFGTVRQGEISRFPYAVMEVKVRNAPKRKKTQWVDDLRNSHLVKDAPKFSKFVHGVASLFERYVNSFPFWVSLMDTDIRRDPNDAFKEEQERKVKQREDEVAVGSLIGSMPKALELAVASPAGRSKSYISTSARQLSGQQLNGGGNLDGVGESTRADEDEEDNAARTTKGLSSIFPAFSTSKYARSRRMSVHLPQGVHAPSQWIKDSGPVKVEPKVWMANQRTYIKWLHIAMVITILSQTLYNAAGASNHLARYTGVGYLILSLFAAGWGYGVYVTRSRMIRERSGKDFDYVVGPIIVTVSFVVAVVLNFAFRYRDIMRQQSDDTAFTLNGSGLTSDEL